MKSELIQILGTAISELGFPNQNIILKHPKNPEHGDFSTNIAMVLSKIAQKNPRDLADEIKAKLVTQHSALFTQIEIAGPGFINFKMNQNLISEQLKIIIEKDREFGRSNLGKGKKALVEFVSANPTGPLTVGHGRGAMLGDTVSNILEWNGFEVEREYYFNNAGRQMRVLGESVRARYLELLQQENKFPEGGYEGEYIINIAQSIVDKNGDKFISDPENIIFKDTAESLIFDDIKATMSRLGLQFDSYYNEHTLYESRKIDAVIEALRNRDLIYEKEGAIWFSGTKVGREVDRVLIKSTGEPTYRLPDMAYHQTKFEREYDLMVDVFGADHMDAYPDVLAVIDELGYDSKKVNVLIHQFVTITKDGKPVKMSTRKANFVTLDELIDEVGEDVVRYFFIMRNMNSHLNFDLNIAKDQSDDNPVFYLQYAHARICNILKRAEAFDFELRTDADLSLLSLDVELNLIQKLSAFPELIERAYTTLEPQNIANYLHDLAMSFHKYYANERVITDNKTLTESRLILIQSLRVVFRNALTVLGISAPEKM